MSIIKFPSGGVATKKAGTTLIATVLDRVATPLSVAGQCRDELRTSLKHVNDVVQHRCELPAAKFNHGAMLPRAELVRTTGFSLAAIAYPNAFATPVVTAETAFSMLSVLFHGVGKAKNVEIDVLLRSWVSMFDPRSNQIGQATELWKPVSRHPAILSLAVQALQFNRVFTSLAELREAMLEAQRTIVQLYRSTDQWIDLLRASDRVVFKFDRPAWDHAYQNANAKVVELMQDPGEAGDDDEDEPASARWVAQTDLIDRKLRDCEGA